MTWAAISPGGSTKSTRPVATALRGMPSYSVVAGSWAITRPPSPLTARTPRVPSLPVPESTTQTAFS
ncbi:MAG: hypothetical protein IPO18_08475 [bacterium]|nr:hypothetical protein [bacterium]